MMVKITSSIILFLLSLSFAFSQPADLYTAGKYPCNGKDLWKALKKCPDGNCQEYKEALAIIEKECQGNGKNLPANPNKADVDDSYGKVTDCPKDPRAKGSYCPYRDVQIRVEGDYWVISHCIKNKNQDHCPCKSGTKTTLVKFPIPLAEKGGSSYKTFIPVIVKMKSPSLSTNPYTPFDFNNYYSGWTSGNNNCPLPWENKPEFNGCESSSPDTRRHHNNNPIECEYFRKYEMKKETDCEFRFIIPGKNTVYFASQTNSTLRAIPNFPVEFFQDSTLVNFRYSFAILFANDPNAEILRRPTLDNPKSILSGEVNSKSYILGIGGGTFYTPVNLIDNGKNGQRLLKAVNSSGSLKNFIVNDLMQDWYEGGARKYIIAYQQGRVMKSYQSPGEIFRSVKMSPRISNPRNLVFLIEERSGNGEAYVQGVNTSRQETFYKAVKRFKNPWLALVAIADPETQVKENFGNKVALLTSNPDELYEVEISSVEDKPRCTEIIKGTSNKPMSSNGRKVMANDLRKESFYDRFFKSKAEQFLKR